MKNIFLLALNTIKVTFRNKANFIVYIILPVASILFLMNIMGGDGSSKVRMGIVNKDNSIISENMVKYLEGTGRFENIPIKEDEISEKVVNKKVDLAIIIPENFEESIYNNNYKAVRISSIKGSEVTGWIENYTNLYIRNLLDISKVANGDREVFKEIYGKYEKGELSLKVEKLQDKSLNKGITQQGFGFFIMFLMISSTLTANLVLKEKKERVYQRICSTPVSQKVYLLGNVVASLFIITIQIILAMLAVKSILKIDTYIPAYQLFIVLFTFGIVIIGFTMLIVAFARSSAEAGNLSTLIITPTCMLGGCLWPASFMPEKLQKIGNFIPQKWAIDAIAKLQEGSSLGDIRLNIVILLGFAVLFFVVSAFKMKSTEKTGSFV
jgi:ABC-2 type transport system permease protein